MGLNLVQRQVVWSCRSYQNLGQIDHNLQNHAFDDVICNQPIILCDLGNACFFHFFVVEFPAVLLDTSSGEIHDEFHRYVQPTENPRLSSFCTHLTGITQVGLFFYIFII